jgi:hypothetical protein
MDFPIIIDQGDPKRPKCGLWLRGAAWWGVRGHSKPGFAADTTRQMPISPIYICTCRRRAKRRHLFLKIRRNLYSPLCPPMPRTCLMTPKARGSLVPACAPKHHKAWQRRVNHTSLLLQTPAAPSSRSGAGISGRSLYGREPCQFTFARGRRPRRLRRHAPGVRKPACQLVAARPVGSKPVCFHFARVRANSTTGDPPATPKMVEEKYRSRPLRTDLS